MCNNNYFCRQKTIYEIAVLCEKKIDELSKLIEELNEDGIDYSIELSQFTVYKEIFDKITENQRQNRDKE